MSNSFKRDIINVVGRDEYIQILIQLHKIYKDVDDNIYLDMINNCKKYNVHLYYIIVTIRFKQTNHLTHMMVCAINENDAKRFVLKKYKKYNVTMDDIICNKVNLEINKPKEI